MVEALDASGLTQVGVAHYLSVSLRTVQNWCSGTATPAGDNLVALGRLLDRRPEWFFEPPRREAA